MPLSVVPSPPMKPRKLLSNNVSKHPLKNGSSSQQVKGGNEIVDASGVSKSRRLRQSGIDKSQIGEKQAFSSSAERSHQHVQGKIMHQLGAQQQQSEKYQRDKEPVDDDDESISQSSSNLEASRPPAQCRGDRELSETNARYGRRRGHDNDANAIQRAERRALATKLQNLSLGNHIRNESNHSRSNNGSLSSYSASFDGADDFSCSSSSSTYSSSGSKAGVCTLIKRNGRGHNGPEIKAVQFSASMSSAVCSDDNDGSNNTFHESLNILNFGGADLNSSSKLLDDTDDPLDSSIDHLLLFDKGMDKNDKVEAGQKGVVKRTKAVNKVENSADSTSSLGQKDDSSSRFNLSLGDLMKKSEAKNKERKKKSTVSSSVCSSKYVDDDDNKTINKTKKKLKEKKETRKKLVSCLKGSNSSKKRQNLKGQVKDKGKVRFESSSKLEQVRLVKCFLKYAKDLYLSEEDIEKLRLDQADFSKATDEEISNVQSYMQAYRQGRQQINYERQLSTDVYQELVIGIRRGYCGMESHSNLHDFICQHIIETTRSIVKAYKCALESDRSRFTATHLSSSSSSKSRPAIDASIMVKAHSEALTETDRAWAFTMGKAQQQASSN